MNFRNLQIPALMILLAVPLYSQISPKTEEPAASSCPTIKIKGPPAVVQPRETMKFRVEVDATNDKIGYEWTIDKGEIISGQGESEIIVGGTEYFTGQTVTAEVIIWGLSPECSNSFSETGVVANRLFCDPLDEFGDLSRDDLRARIDNLLIQMQADPNATGYVVTYGPPNEVSNRHKIIRDHLEFREYDQSKITLDYRSYQEKLRSSIWIVPAGAGTECIN